jgi:two-component system sensor histidine kinase RegB
VRATIRSFFEPPLSATSEQSTGKLVWIVRLRWLAITAQFLTIFPALEFKLLEAEMLAYFTGVIVLLAALNLATWVALRRGAAATPGRILFQLACDVIGLTCMLVLTGGAWNPMVPILFVHTVLGALLLEGRLSLFFFALQIGCLLLLQGLGQLTHVPPGLQGALIPRQILFPAQLVVAGVFWILTAWLSSTLRGMTSQFAQLQERQTGIDRLRAVGALAAGLSHELATPLNTAQLKLARLGRTPELLGDTDLKTATEALEHCRDVLRHMAGAPLQADRLHLEVVDVDEIVSQVCAGIQLEHEHVAIHVSTHGLAPRRALVPAVAFSQALLNLIENAIEAGDSDSIEVMIDNREGRTEVSILDRGKGWPQVVRSHIGEPFVTTKPDGVGLGLYFVHSLAAAVGGELQLQDRSDGGAIARVRFPKVSSVEAAGIERGSR